MDTQVQNLIPDYKRIFTDILDKKFPHKIDECKKILQKEKLEVMDILTLDRIIFGLKDQSKEIFDQQHRAYDHSAVLEILHYQDKKQLTNSQLAAHFKLSRNTVAKWKKAFL